jgi:hypothetical protein
MSTYSPPLVATVVSPSGGANASFGSGMEYQFTLAYTAASGAQANILLTNQLTNIQTQLGYGYVTGQIPIMAYTYSNKVYTLSGSNANFSAVADPTTWNNPSGNFNGFVTISNYYATQKALTSMSQFQGRLAFFTDWAIIIFIIDPNPANWQLQQTITNMGTFATNSISTLGNLDTIFLSYSGYRSLRAIQTTLFGYIDDLGSAIDQFVQNDIQQSTIAVAQAACSITDPQTGRYWGFIPNTSNVNGVGSIYIFSQYRSSKVEAWSTYDPSYISGGMTYYFTPTKFLVYNGQVYARASDGNLYQYGGSNANTYDATLATATIPFMDAKRPTEIKKAMSLDADVTGTWTLSASSDWINKVYQKVAIVTQATFDQGFLAWSSQGTHLSVQATTVAAVQAQIAEVVMGFEPGNEPVE